MLYYKPHGVYSLSFLIKLAGCVYFINMYEVPSHALMDGEISLLFWNFHVDGEVCVCLPVMSLKDCHCSRICQHFWYGQLNKTISELWLELIKFYVVRFTLLNTKTCIFWFVSLLLIGFYLQNSLRLAKSSLPLMFSMMLWKVKNTEHGRKSTSRLCWSTWNSVWISARVIWQKKDCTSTRIFASRYGFWFFFLICSKHGICQLIWS